MARYIPISCSLVILVTMANITFITSVCYHCRCEHVSRLTKLNVNHQVRPNYSLTEAANMAVHSHFHSPDLCLYYTHRDDFTFYHQTLGRLANKRM